MPERIGEMERNTAETSVKVTLNLDGTGHYHVETGNGFFNHMISQLARHGLFDINVLATGDNTGSHHLVEDTGIVLGRAFREAVGEAKGIRRMGYAYVPFDETLAMVAVDCSGRPYHRIQTGLDEVPMVGTLAGSEVRHFLESFAVEARITLHASVLAGIDPHHKAEALCKALARALRDAVERDPRAMDQIPSTKGTLT